ncbi:hypothetical protein Hanom_Chr09g00791101 [Helianthus anomalus]
MSFHYFIFPKTSLNPLNLRSIRQIWIANEPLEYHRATSGTTRLYPSPLGIMPIHQFRRKPNKYGKTPCRNRTQDLLVPEPYLTQRCN